jgi:hypothetical protein
MYVYILIDIKITVNNKLELFPKISRNYNQIEVISLKAKTIDEVIEEKKKPLKILKKDNDYYQPPIGGPEWSFLLGHLLLIID